jgi:hypothetical protein
MDDISSNSATFPGGQNISVTSGSRTLAPGNYGIVTVSNGATLTLSSGSYTFLQLTLNNDTRWVLNDTAGLINIAVRDSFGFFERITTTASSGPNPKLLLRFQGTTSPVPVLFFFSSFTGSIYAPRAELNFQRGNPVPGGQKPYAGVFVARRIIAMSDVKVTHAPLIVFDN